jgi:hypothetical protein
MGTVYLAVDRKHGRKVALKVLTPDLAYGAGTGALPEGDRDRSPV